MNWIEALILGLIQGLTEFLPVSSSGHLEIGKVILGIEARESLMFTVVVHGATVLSTIVIFRKDLLQLIRGFFSKGWNEQKAYILKLAISMVPVLILGILFKDQIEALFTGNLVLVGGALMVTASLLAFTYFFKEKQAPITYGNSIVMGIAQAIAVIPGISRSGSTIATGLMMGGGREWVARFSFLMVLVPIIGANLKDVADNGLGTGSVGVLPLVVGFITAFLSGLLACKAMIGIVKRGKLIWFAIYCFIIGGIALTYALLN